MKKVVFTLLFAMPHIYASNVSAFYDVDFSIVGTIAEGSMNRIQEDDHYIITLQAHAVGIAAELTKDRSETYISQGSIVGPEFIPDVMVVKRKTNDIEKYTIYKFDHQNRVVQKETAEIRRVRSTSMDIRNMRIVETVNEEFSCSSVQNDYYARNDIVSLFFNSRYYMGSMNAGERKKLRAVGIKTNDGELLVSLTATETDAVGKKNDSFGITINKDYFKNGKGELLVRLDPDGFPSKATMNNVLLFGDVVGKRRYREVASKL